MAMVKGVTEGGQEFAVETSQLHGDPRVYSYVVQEAFDALVPSERGCDWWKSTVEPWATIARKACP